MAIAVALSLTGCGGGDGQQAASTTTSRSTTSTSVATTTTTTVSPVDEVESLEPFDSTVAQYIDLVSAGIPLFLDGATGSGIPTEDRGGAIGGEVAPGVSVFALGESLDDQVRGAVALVDLDQQGGTTPTQFVATVLGSLDLANTTAVDSFRVSVLPGLTTISEPLQRFALGAVTLELAVVGDATIAFAFVKSGQSVPAFVYDL